MYGKDLNISTLGMESILLSELQKLKPGECVYMIVGKRCYSCSNELEQCQKELRQRCSDCDTLYCYTHTCTPIAKSYDAVKRKWKGLGKIPYVITFVDDHECNRYWYGPLGENALRCINLNDRQKKKKLYVRRHRKKIKLNTGDLVDVKHVY